SDPNRNSASRGTGLRHPDVTHGPRRTAFPPAPAATSSTCAALGTAAHTNDTRSRNCRTRRDRGRSRSKSVFCDMDVLPVTTPITGYLQGARRFLAAATPRAAAQRWGVMGDTQRLATACPG